RRAAPVDADVELRVRQAQARHAGRADGDVTLAGMLEQDDTRDGPERLDGPAGADDLGTAAAGTHRAGLAAGEERHGRTPPNRDPDPQAGEQARPVGGARAPGALGLSLGRSTYIRGAVAPGIGRERAVSRRARRARCASVCDGGERPSARCGYLGPAVGAAI